MSDPAWQPKTILYLPYAVARQFADKGLVPEGLAATAWGVVVS